jgi:pantothenate kinase
MSEDLVEYFKLHLRQGASISQRVVKALKKIEEEESRDLSEVIHHIEIAETNFHAALNKIDIYERDTIQRVEAKYRAMYRTPRNSSANFISNLWKRITNET